MKNPLSILLAGMIASQSALATLTPTIERGEKNVYYTSPRGIQEVCVIPAKYPGAKYSHKDLKKEQELCNYTFYPTSATEEAEHKQTVALCAKTNSTNPAVNIYEIDTGKGETQASIEKNDCDDADKIGKYKNSTSCSYTPSILAYYHVSRALGGIGNVPVSVLRSMDIETHKSLAKEGLKNTKSGELINQTWAGLNSILNQGLAHSKKDLVLTDDGQQSYGAFIVNPNGEAMYKELFNSGADRAAAFRDQNALFKLVKDSRSLSDIVTSDWNQGNVQKLFAMRDITEFILLDHILDQQDRFGNIAYQTQSVYMGKDKAEDTSFEVKSSLKQKDVEKDKSEGLVDNSKPVLQVKQMTLKDNDCGVSKSNVVKQAQLLSYVRHMNPKTYKRLLELQKSVVENKKFFISNLMFTGKDFDEMVANINDAVKTLKGNCESGKLRLDLDIETYLETGKPSTGSCSL
jgi:hypothetical protein